MASEDLTDAQVTEALAQRRRALKAEGKGPASADPDPPGLPLARRVPGGRRNENWRVTVDGEDLLVQFPAPAGAFHLDKGAYPYPKPQVDRVRLDQSDVLRHFSARGMSWSPRLR